MPPLKSMGRLLTFFGISFILNPLILFIADSQFAPCCFSGLFFALRTFLRGLLLHHIHEQVDKVVLTFASHFRRLRNVTFSAGADAGSFLDLKPPSID